MIFFERKKISLDFYWNFCAVPHRSILHDFQDAHHVYPDDLALDGVGEALQLSQSALTYDVRLLEAQLFGRMRSSRAGRNTLFFLNVVNLQWFRYIITLYLQDILVVAIMKEDF